LGWEEEDDAGRPAQKVGTLLPIANDGLQKGWEKMDECRLAGGRSWKSLLCVFVAVLAGLTVIAACVYSRLLQLPSTVSAFRLHGWPSRALGCIAWARACSWRRQLPALLLKG